MFDGLDKMMMIVPIDAEVDETQHLAEKNRNQRAQGRRVRAERRPQLQHHDGDDDGDHAITEGFHSVFVHVSILLDESP